MNERYHLKPGPGGPFIALALLGGLMAGGVSGSALAEPIDCDALRNSTVAFEYTRRMDARYVLREGDEETHKITEDRTRVLRGEAGRVTTFLISDGNKTPPIINDKHYWRTLKMSSGEKIDSEYVHDTPLTYDPVARKEDFIEVYTRIRSDGPPRRQKVEAVFVSEGSVMLGDCEFKTHRYRSTLFNEPFEDKKPTTIATIDYVPELMIQAKSESQSEAPGSKWALNSSAIAISTNLAAIPGVPGNQTQK